MGDFQTISRKQFNKATNKHKPNGWIRFAFKYFSKSTETKDFMLKNVLTTVLLALFGFIMVGGILNLSRTYMSIVVLSYTFLLSGLVLYLFSAVILNNIRINKIRKILGVSKEEYNYLVRKFED